MYVVNLQIIQLGHSALRIITHSVLKSKFHFNETDFWSVRTTNQAQITRSPIHMPDKGALTTVTIHSIYWIVVS